MSSLAHRPNAQAVLDLYGYSDRLQIVAALNEDQRRHRVTDALRRAVARLRTARPHRSLPVTPPARAQHAAVIGGASGRHAGSSASC